MKQEPKWKQHLFKNLKDSISYVTVAQSESLLLMGVKKISETVTKHLRMDLTIY